MTRSNTCGTITPQAQPVPTAATMQDINKNGPAVCIPGVGHFKAALTDPCKNIYRIRSMDRTAGKCHVVCSWCLCLLNQTLKFIISALSRGCMSIPARRRAEGEGEIKGGPSGAEALQLSGDFKHDSKTSVNAPCDAHRHEEATREDERTRGRAERERKMGWL